MDRATGWNRRRYLPELTPGSEAIRNVLERLSSRGGYVIFGGERGVAVCSASERGNACQGVCGEPCGVGRSQSQGSQTPSRIASLRGTCPCAHPNTDKTAERETKVTLVPKWKLCNFGPPPTAELRSKRDGGDDGDGGGGAVRKRAPDMRMPLTTRLPQEISSWLES
jgi:hypothetical protein